MLFSFRLILLTMLQRGRLSYRIEHQTCQGVMLHVIVLLRLVLYVTMLILCLLIDVWVMHNCFIHGNRLFFAYMDNLSIGSVLHIQIISGSKDDNRNIPFLCICLLCLIYMYCVSDYTWLDSDYKFWLDFLG